MWGYRRLRHLSERDQGGGRTVATTRQRTDTAFEPTSPAVRWECHCQTPPVLLATWQPGGRVNIKVRDRYWHFDGFGTVRTVCPRCATSHELDLGVIPPAVRQGQDDA